MTSSVENGDLGNNTLEPAKNNKVVWAMVAILAVYLLAALADLPQRATQIAVEAHTVDSAASGTVHDALDHAVHHGALAGANASLGTPSVPPYWSVTPFVLLLAAIALFPLIQVTEHWWDSNANRFKVAAVLAAITLSYYAFIHSTSVEAHWPSHQVIAAGESFFQTGFVGAVLGNALLSEYVPFIVLLFSLYTIAGGIRIEGDLQANPMTNASFMAAGGLLASFVGTTGAAMLLIRPLLETNKERKHVSHTVVFFIFIVCNCGGCLLPIGDPPLFLGYLAGVDFTWTLGLWEEWLFVNGLLLLAYCVADQFFFYPQESLRDIKRDITQTRRLQISGLALNGPLLLGVVLAVALLDPKKEVPGTHWHAWMYLREAIQLALVTLALYLGSPRLRQKNDFNYHAIVEVAVLFLGIFVCMQPALQILAEKGEVLAKSLSPAGFFWATGGLSAFLDNAPTYLVFFMSAQDPTMMGATGGVPEMILRGIALGAVFMGAMTYIGNGPNFMVKAIAEKSGVRMPSFFGYMMYSSVVLLPILALMHWRYLPPEDAAPQTKQVVVAASSQQTLAGVQQAAAGTPPTRTTP
ncbi:MAG: sodium:proton antiporter [Pirellulales bacterium]|nr:sodium:proton antiporter [Pirellulales bacterium]